MPIHDLWQIQEIYECVEQKYIETVLSEKCHGLCQCGMQVDVVEKQYYEYCGRSVEDECQRHQHSKRKGRYRYHGKRYRLPFA